MNFFNIIKIQLKMILKNPATILQFLVLPMVLTIIIGYLTKDDFSGKVTSYQYYSVGVMLFMYTGYGVIGAFNFIDKNVVAGNVRLIFAPVNAKWIFASHIVSSTLFGAGTIMVNMVLYKLLFQVGYHNYAVVVFLAYSSVALVSSTIGILLSIITGNAILIEEIFTICQLVLCLAGGCFFSVESIGNIPDFAAYISPVKWIMDGMNDCLYKGSITELCLIIAANTVLSAAAIITSIKLFKTEKYV